MRWLYVIGLLMMLAACTPEVIVTEPPFYTATAPTFEDALAGVGGASTPMSLTFGGGQPIAVELPGAFEFRVEGAILDEADTGTVVYNYIPRVGAQLARDQIFISASDADSSQQIVFQFTPGLEIGTYLLTVPDDTVVPGVVTAQYSRLGTDASGGTSIQFYTQNVGGTLTLTEVGTLISGVFTFRVERAIASDDDSEPIVEQVAIAGRFVEVPYSRLDDPFVNPPPAPTQATPDLRP